MTQRLYRVVFTDDADMALEEAIEKIQENSLQNAKSVRMDILHKSASLKYLPNRFSAYEPQRNPLKIYRSFVIHNHIVVYQVFEDLSLVAILDVHHGKQNR